MTKYPAFQQTPPPRREPWNEQQALVTLKFKKTKTKNAPSEKVFTEK